MADPTTPTASEKAELEAFRAKDKREKRILADMADRRAICQGMIPDNMLREISTRQIDDDDRKAAASK